MGIATSTVKRGLPSAKGARSRRPNRHDAAPDPLYRQLADELTEMIATGALRPGDRLPGVRGLSLQRRVSLSTVLAAYRRLEDRGVVEVRPQSGHYVASRPLLSVPRPEPSRPPVVREEVNVAEMIQDILSLVNDPNVAPFGVATSDPTVYPGRRLNGILARIARESPTNGISYGPTRGHADLIHQIVRRAVAQGMRVDPGEVIVTNGATEAMWIALRAMTQPGDTVLVESPTYYGILNLAQSLGLKVVELPTCTEEGIEPQHMATVLRKLRAKVLITMPTTHNPLGIAMPEKERAHLMEVCAEHGVTVIEDGVYADLHYEAPRPRPLRAFAPKGTDVLSIGSFSKTLAAGYRVGWLLAGRHVDAALKLRFSTSMQTNGLAQLAIAEYLAGYGAEHHLRGLRQRFKGQVADYSCAIARHFPDGTKVTRPTGGHILWVELPEEVDSLVLAKRALKAGIGIMPGRVFAPGDRYLNHFRLNCGFALNDRLESKLAELGKMVDHMT
jgi:DNA-binding transcriptional MocR family regulator